MDEDPFILAAWMAEEERLRLEKKAAERRQQRKLLDSYQPHQYDQRPNRSIGKWFILGAVIIIIYLLVTKPK
jgi:Mg2+/citrate symporter